jgi:hypothetical protein
MYQDDWGVRKDKREDTRFRQSVLNILSDEDTSDVSFNVKGQLLYAHLNILKAMAPDFVRTLNLDDQDKAHSVPIEDVDPEIFQTMLKHIYGEDIYI